MFFFFKKLVVLCLKAKWLRPSARKKNGMFRNIAHVAGGTTFGQTILSQ